MAMPWPPPTHIVSSPIVLSSSFSSWRRVVMILGTRHSERMTQGDSPTVRVQLCPVDAKVPGRRDNLRSECLVHLDNVDVIHCQASSIKCLATSSDRPTGLSRDSTR